MSLTIYTASRNHPFSSQVDYEINVADRKMRLFDMSACRVLWAEIAQSILDIADKFVRLDRDMLDKEIIVMIRCHHGLHRSVQTAERLRKEYLCQLTIPIRVKHLTWTRPKAKTAILS